MSTRVAVITLFCLLLAVITITANWARSFSLFTPTSAASAANETDGEYVPDGLSRSDWAEIRAAYDANRPTGRRLHRNPDRRSFWQLESGDTSEAGRQKTRDSRQETAGRRWRAGEKY